MGNIIIFEIKDSSGAVVHTVWLPPGSYTVTPQANGTQGGGGPGSVTPPV